MSTKLTAAQRLWAKVNKNGPIPEHDPSLGPCWIWGGTKVTGYGRISVNGRMEMAHRYSWELANGPIPQGLHLDHICQTPACVRPGHLRTATVKQNLEHRGGPTASNKSTGVRGVYRSGKGYAARLGHNGKDYHFGTYDTIAEAEAVVIEGRRSLFTFPESAGSLTQAYAGVTTAARRAADRDALEQRLQEWETLYGQGQSTYTIGHRYGVSASTVFRALQKRGVKFRSRGGS